MGFELTPDIEVRRDAEGRIRQLRHVYRPYAEKGPSAFSEFAVTPRRLAEAYLRDTAELFGLSAESTSNFSASVAAAPTHAPVELRFQEEKSTGRALTVSYDQTVMGLPVWDAGMTVRINAEAMQVTGAHNATHYGVEPQAPSAGARFLPNSIDTATMAGLLGLGADAELSVSATRALIYRCDPQDRFDPEAEAHDQPDEHTGFAGEATPPLPKLPLPDLPPELEPGRHYVVTEVLFRHAARPWGELNWRAFVHPDTGAVLYLRALVACAHGSVFATDPVTSSGVEHGASVAASVLDLLRKEVPLNGLGEPGPDGRQALAGKYVRLVDLEAPTTGLPSEASPFRFVYSCDTDDFAACNAYHHCDGFFRLLEEMGIDVESYFNDTDFPVPVDPHAKAGEVNASAPGNVAGNGLGRLVFGLARTNSSFGISADARVVIHEFGHAVLWDHVRSPNFGWAHSPGDSLAAILHDPGSRAPDRFETFPFMKNSAGLSRRHDRRVEEGWAWGGSRDDRRYGSEQILSTTLFRVYRAAGGDSADPATRLWASRYVAYLVLKGVSLLSFTTLDPDVFVAALTEADASTARFEGHPGGVFAKVFRWSFEQQGLYQPAGAPAQVRRAGAAPPVDVYIEDGRGGGYMPYQGQGEGVPEIWNRLAADGGAEHQAPQPDAENFAFVRVRNRGTELATEVRIRGYRAVAPSATLWPDHWEALETAIDLPAPLAPGAAVVAGPFAWTPAREGERLMLEVSAAGDRSVLEHISAGPVLTARAVPLDNNLAVRAF